MSSVRPRSGYGLGPLIFWLSLLAYAVEYYSWVVHWAFRAPEGCHESIAAGIISVVAVASVFIHIYFLYVLRVAFTVLQRRKTGSAKHGAREVTAFMWRHFGWQCIPLHMCDLIVIVVSLTVPVITTMVNPYNVLRIHTGQSDPNSQSALSFHIVRQTRRLCDAGSRPEVLNGRFTYPAFAQINRADARLWRELDRARMLWDICVQWRCTTCTGSRTCMAHTEPV
jgi:hypothetical protein